MSHPPQRFFPEVRQAVEVAALEKPFPDVLDATLHLGLVLGVSHPGGVGDEAPVLGVFQEAPVSLGCSPSAPATAAGKLSMTRYLGMPPKKPKPPPVPG